MERLIKKIVKMTLALAMILTLLPMNIMAEQSDLNTLIIDDFSDQFEYSEGNANNGGWDCYPEDGSGDAATTEHWSNTVGASLKIKFNGSRITLFGKKATNHKKFSVRIDDQTVSTCDAYAANKTDNNSVLYDSKDAGIVLQEGSHTLVLTILDEVNENAVQALGMNIAYAKVYSTSTTTKVTTIVEDSMITDTDEFFKIKYHGEWNGGDFYPDFHGGTERYANNGDSFDMKFIGTKVELFGTKAAGHGQYSVSIDGKDCGLANATADRRINQQLLFQSEELENTEHNIHVELKNQPNMAIQLDYMKVYHDRLQPLDITFNKSEFVFAPGDTALLNVNLQPWNASTDELVWESSNLDVVSVDQVGNVEAKAVKQKATANVKVSLKSDKSVFAEATIVVDPSLSYMNAYVGDEKILDLSEQYDALKNGTKKSYQATAWKNDVLSSKIILCTQGSAKQVQFVVSDFTNENGDVLAKDNVSVKWLKNVKSKVGRNSQGPTKDFPAIIHNSDPKDIPSKTATFAWVSIKVPTDTKPGMYTGVIQVSSESYAEPVELTYTVEVLDVLQPELENTEIQIWQHPFSVANYYLGLGKENTGGISYEKRDDFYFSEEHFNLMRASMKEYASIGGHDVVANIVEEAWNHQSYYNDSSMVKWTKKADGSFTFDYTWYDKWIDFMISCGVIDPATNTGKIKCYSIVPWNNQIAYFDEGLNRTVKRSFRPGSDEFKDIWSAFLTDFMRHSELKGWFDITYISMDERGMDQLLPAVDVIESVKNSKQESFKISSCLNYSAPQYYDFTDRIHDISINLDNCSKEVTNALSSHRKELGLTTTYYTCTGNYPGNFIISDPGDNYWTMLYTMSLGTDGFLRWAWDNYVYGMHDNITYRYWEPGDGWFIYPVERENLDMSKDVPFYSTPKYELFKKGVMDVAKAKYLMSVGEQQEQAIKDLMSQLNQPSAGNYYGSATPSNQATRNKLHQDSNLVMEGIHAIARDLKLANYQRVDEAIKKAETLNRDNYADFSKVDEAIANVIRGKDISEQAQVDAMADAIEYAINNLVAKTVLPVSMSATLTDQISMNVYLNINPSVLEEQDAYVLFTASKTQTQKVMLKGLQPQANGLYKVSMPLNARQMSDEITMQVYTSIESKTYSYSIQMYGEKVLSSQTTTTEQKAVVEAMLNYGAMAQVYFDYNTNKLANVLVTNKDYTKVTAKQLVDYAPVITGNINGMKYGGTNVRLLSETAIRHHFVVTKEIQDLYQAGTLKFVQVIGNVEKDIAPTFYDNKAFIEVKHIFAVNLNQTNVVKVKNIATNEEITLSYSVYSYALEALEKSNNTKLQDVMKAMVVYNQKAKEYKERLQ